MNRHTTYGIGGPADCFVMPQTTEELKKVLSKAHEEGIPVTFIGGGSNLLVSDLGIRGITVCTSRLKQDMTCHETWITAMGGVGTGTAGYMIADSQGKWRGLSVDVCRAVAAAIFGDAEKVRYIPLTSQQRFTALQSGEVDMTMGNAPYTLTRDSALGFDFTGVYYYDG